VDLLRTAVYFTVSAAHLSLSLSLSLSLHPYLALTLPVVALPAQLETMWKVPGYIMCDPRDPRAPNPRPPQPTMLVFVISLRRETLPHRDASSFLILTSAAIAIAQSHLRQNDGAQPLNRRGLQVFNEPRKKSDNRTLRNDFLTFGRLAADVF